MKLSTKNNILIVMMILAIILFVMLLNKKEGFNVKLPKCITSGKPKTGKKCCIENPPNCNGVCGGPKCTSTSSGGLKSSKPTIMVATGTPNIKEPDRSKYQ